MPPATRGNSGGGVGGRDLVNDTRGTNYNPTLGANVTLSGANLIRSQVSIDENKDISPVPVVGAITGPTPTTADPQLGALANNGGPTQAMRVSPSSPAYNAGTTASGITTDQRGHARSATTPSIGAYEAPAYNESLVVTTTADENDGTSDPSISKGKSLREAVAYYDTLSTPAIITFDPSLAGQTITLT